MSARLTQKINGTTYVYENVPEWNARKKATVYKRKYLGKEVDGKFVPNAAYALELKNKNKAYLDPEDLFASTLKAKACGATEFLDSLSRRLGIVNDLEVCFPDDYSMIESLAYYLALEFDRPVNRFHRWSLTHEHPYQEDIPDFELIELQKRLPQKNIRDFLKKQMLRRCGTNVTIYSHDILGSLEQTATLLRQGAPVKELPWSRLFTFYSSSSGLPCAFELGSSNCKGINELEFLKNTLKDFGNQKPLLISGESLAEELSIEWLLREHWKFIVQEPDPLLFFERNLGRLQLPTPKDQRGWQWNELLQMFVSTKTVRRKIKNSYRNLFVHCFFLPELAYGSSLLPQQARSEIPSLLGDFGEKDIVYFHTFGGGLASDYGVRLIPNQFLYAPSKNQGLFILLSNCESDPIQACNAFRRQDFQYALFSNISEKFYLRPFSYCGGETGAVRLSQFFLQFLGLVLFDATRKEHSKSGLWSEMYHTTLLDILDTVQRYTQPGKGSKVSRLNEEQKEIYRKLGQRMPGRSGTIKQIK